MLHARIPTIPTNTKFPSAHAIMYLLFVYTNPIPKDIT